jgi:hypothetical protein
VSKHRTGFLFPVVNGQSFNPDEKNVYVVRRGFSYSIIAICHARVSMLPFDQVEYPDQDKGRMMELPTVAPAPVVRDHAVVCRGQVDHQG